MRAALHPTVRACLADPEQLQMTLDWIVHASLPSVTNEAAFFDSYKAPNPLSNLQPSAFDRLTNRASRLSYIPPIPRLSLVYADGKRDSVSRPIPGVDYPGIAPEDAGSTPHCLRIALCAPKNQRRFKVLAEIPRPRAAVYEFKWMPLVGSAYMPANRDPVRTSSWQMIVLNTSGVTPKRPLRIAVFAREKGGIWGPPGIIDFRPDDFGSARTYEKGLVYSIDYGSFKDVYRYDEKNRLLGFTRYDALDATSSEAETSTVHLHLFSPPKSLARGADYSNLGELIVDGYSDDRPKTTRKAVYSSDGGKICYTVDNVEIRHKNEPPEDRAAKW